MNGHRYRRARIAVIGSIGVALIAVVAARMFDLPITRFRALGPSGDAVVRTKPVVQRVDRGDIIRTINASGTLNPVNQVLVGTQASGRIRALHADFNTVVARGQLLAELDTATLDADLGSALAQLDGALANQRLAEAELRRSLHLADQGFVTRSELEQAQQQRDGARAQVAQHESNVRRARTALGYAQVRSPVSGTVVSRDVSVGQTVQSNFSTPTLFRIAEDLRSMRIEAAVSEADIGTVAPGMSVAYSVDAYPERQFTATVREVRNNYAVQQNVVTYTVVIDAPNQDLALRPGMTAYVNIEVVRRTGALRVPNAALRYAAQVATAGDGPPVGLRRVWRVSADGSVRALDLRVGVTDGRHTEALGDAVEPGDDLVIGLPPTDGGPPVPRLF